MLRLFSFKNIINNFITSISVDIEAFWSLVYALCVHFHIQRVWIFFWLFKILSILITKRLCPFAKYEYGGFNIMPIFWYYDYFWCLLSQLNKIIGTLIILTNYEIEYNSMYLFVEFVFIWIFYALCLFAC